ncbi:MAG TPA: hypothetical protein VHG30_16795 [Microvirga sp.]|jgi:hypothetical protein|nr:hypothetical protein [Microvirga sp.]
MPRPTDQRPPDRLRPQERRGKPQATLNTRLKEQIRKVLRKHYANKYRVR